MQVVPGPCLTTEYVISSPRPVGGVVLSSYDYCLTPASKHVSALNQSHRAVIQKRRRIHNNPLGISALIQRPTILSHYHRRSYLHHSPIHSPTVQSFHPLPVQCFPFHLSTYHGRLHMVAPLPLLSSLSGDQFSSKPLDQIVPISSKGIYQVPGFCCKVVKEGNG